MAGLGKGPLKEKQGVQAKKINREENETKAARVKERGVAAAGGDGQPAGGAWNARGEGGPEPAAPAPGPLWAVLLGWEPAPARVVRPALSSHPRSECMGREKPGRAGLRRRLEPWEGKFYLSRQGIGAGLPSGRAGGR